MGPGFPGQALEFEVVRAVVSPTGIGLDVGNSQDLKLGFLELTVFIEFNEF